MANRTAPILSQMFAFGVHRSIVLTNPVSLLFKPGGKESSSDRVLSETECHAFIHGAELVCIARVRYHTLMVLLLTLHITPYYGFHEDFGPPQTSLIFDAIVLCADPLACDARVAVSPGLF